MCKVQARFTHIHTRTYIFHAHTHVPLDDDTALATAEAFKKDLEARFSSDWHFFGRTHARPIGPHPQGQFELVFTRADYIDVVTWLTFNRPSPLSIFIHPHSLDVCMHASLSRPSWRCLVQTLADLQGLPFFLAFSKRPASRLQVADCMQQVFLCSDWWIEMRDWQKFSLVHGPTHPKHSSVVIQLQLSDISPVRSHLNHIGIVCLCRLRITAAEPCGRPQKMNSIQIC